MIPTMKDYHLSKSPPLGISYIASNLEKHGIKVKIIDSPNLGLSHKGVLSQVKRFKPDFVGISVTMQSYKSAKKHLEQFKAALPNCIFVFGGPIVTFESDKIMKDCRELDFCVRGEGEETMLDLIQTLTAKKSLKKVSGLTWKHEGKIIRNPDRALIPDLDQLPYPAFHLLPMKEYQGSANFGGGKPFATIIGTRGCIFQCSFCAAAIMWRGQRRRKVNNILDEIEMLVKKYRIRFLHFPDDLFIANKAFVKSFCQGMIERKYNKIITWSCNGRVDLTDREILNNLKQAGCDCVFYGIESGNQKILDAIDKRIKLSQIRKTVKTTHEAGLRVSGSFLIGYPGETKKTIEQTVNLAIELDFDYASFHLVVPYPGTRLYKQCLENGWLLSHNWEDYVLDVYGEPNQSVIKLKHIPHEELIKLYRWANKRFTNRLSYMWKIFRYHPAFFLKTASKTIFSFLKPKFLSTAG